MIYERNIYTGYLIYKDINFTFVFDKKELILISPIENKLDIMKIFWTKQIEENTYAIIPNTTVGEKYLIGECNEILCKIVFMTDDYLSLCNHIIKIKVKSYIILKDKIHDFSRIDFTCQDIDYIYPVNNAFVYTYIFDKITDSSRVIIEPNDFDKIRTKEQIFYIKDKEIKIHFSMTGKLKSEINNNPLTITSSLIFKFEETSDYEFLLYLLYIAREFICFLCYRSNICIQRAEIFSYGSSGKFRNTATLFFIDQNKESDLEVLKKGYYIKQEYIDGHEGEILTDIVKNNICLRHIPDSYQSSKSIDAARFIMITAAFEWEFKRWYAQHYKTVLSKFDNKKISSMNFKEKMIHVCNDFQNIISIFGNSLYQKYNITFDCNDIGERLRIQRNNYAHGNLDQNLDTDVIIDIIFTQYIIYIMQLKQYNIDDMNIKRAINDLFHCRLSL